MNTAEALQIAFPQQFPKGKDHQAVANHILAEKLVEPLFLAVHFPPRMENIRRLNLSWRMQLEQIQDTDLDEVLKIMVDEFFIKEELHGENKYRLGYRFPETGPAERLVALQFIPPGIESNPSHRHFDQNRVENIFIIKGRYRINFHNPQNLDVIVSSQILNPFEGVVIDPRRYHSVANTGDCESIALILGTPVVDSAIFSR